MIILFRDQQEVTSAGELANTFLSRFLGLMGRTTLPADYCLILTPCSSIHMAFMRISLDIAYLDRAGNVIGLQWDLKPWRVGALYRGTRTVLEAPVGGVLRQLQVGDRIQY